MKTLITQARLINEGNLFEGDLLIDGGRIQRIASQITADASMQVVDGRGRYLIPGMIDDQVHFREPGLTHKGDLASESLAAVMGGITSFMEMPNCNPTTTHAEALTNKHLLAAQKSAANYGFYLGATNDNLIEIQRVNQNLACGVKVFMGASTGNMLVDAPEVLEAIFRDCPILVATHCENTPMIKAQEDIYRAQYGEDIPIELHPKIRSAEACYHSSSFAVQLAKKFETQLHVLHLTSAKELALFEAGPIQGKKITAEVCVHHAFFSEQDYERLGSQIKCNPAIKSLADRNALIAAVANDVIDVIATDHAPHTWEEKQNTYFKSPAGLPLVQHAVLCALEHVHAGRWSLPHLVRKISHNPADLFKVADRGYLREGYWADLVLVDFNQPYRVTKENIRYKCGWSPFQDYEFRSSIAATWVNGILKVHDGQWLGDATPGQALVFKR